MGKKVEALHETYRLMAHPVSPETMDRVAQEPGFLRFQFKHKDGEWHNEFPPVHTRRQLAQIERDPPLTRAVFEAKPN